MTTDAAARALLDAVAGPGPAGVWSAPGRVNLIGEHTDYNDGLVLPFAIDRRTYVAARRRSDRRIRVASTLAAGAVEVALDEVGALFPAGRGAVPEWARYALGVAWALVGETGAAPPGVDLAVASEVPVGAGLSSSAAIECAVAAALDEVWGLGLDPLTLAQAGRRAENEAVGAPTGIMDQLAAMLGRPGAALLVDCRSFETEHVALDLGAADLAVLVIDTRVSHAHSTGGYADRRAACERGAETLGVRALRDLAPGDLPRAADLLDKETFRRVRHVVTEDERVREAVRVLRTEGPRALGPILLAGHRSLRDDFEVSVPALDAAVQASVSAGALGARMTGGGFGGSAIALVPAEATATVIEAVGAAFEASGFAAPRCFAVIPSAGARRDA